MQFFRLSCLSNSVLLVSLYLKRRCLYLLDDPLAAVDVHVGSRLFANVIGSNGMLSDCTRIFVTNAFQWLPQCDFVLALDAGTPIFFGTCRVSLFLFAKFA